MPHPSLSRIAHAALLTLGLFAAAAANAAPSTQLTVRGAVNVPATYDLAGLDALAPTVQTDTFLSGSASQTHVYTGTSLWGLLNQSGIVTHSNKNDVLNRYVLATGSDGYRTVFSLGELDPSFGDRPDLVAYAETTHNVSSPLTSDGFARITAAGDVKGGRYVSNLTDLTVRSSGSTTTATGGGVSTRFAVSGAVKAPSTFELATLESLPAITETIGGNTYTGVSFWSLLNSTVGLALNPSIKNDVLDKYVVATGTDGYKSLFSLGELDTGFGGSSTLPDLIAYEENGVLFGSGAGSPGFARVVVPGDLKAGRWVSNLASLEVFTAAAVPEPSTCALMFAGLGAIAWSARRRSPSVRRNRV